MKKKSFILLTMALCILTLVFPSSVFADVKSTNDNVDENVEIMQDVISEGKEDYNEGHASLNATIEFQVKIANADGSFTFVSTHMENFKEAVVAMNENESDNAVVVDINETKVYAMKKGIAVNIGPNGTVTTSDGYTYIVNNTVMSFYEADYMNTVKIGVSGYIGNMPYGYITLIPAAFVDSGSYLYGSTSKYTQSYYIKDNNDDLRHYIARFSGGVDTEQFDENERIYVSSIMLDQAPDFMEDGIKYYSIDGVNFYTDPYLMLDDTLKATVYAGTYYPYFQYLSIRSKSSYSSDDIDSYMASKDYEDSVLNNNSHYFLEAEEEYGINASMLFAWACHEAGYGTSGYATERNNLFGINAVDSNPDKADYFDTVGECIDYMADRKLSCGYLDARAQIDFTKPASDYDDPYYDDDDYTRYNGDFRYFGSHLGNKKAGMNIKYASDPYWGEKIAGHTYRMYKFLWGEEYGKYTIGITSCISDVKADISEDSWTVYSTCNKNNSYPSCGLSVLITDEDEQNYKIQSDMPMKNDGRSYYFWHYNYTWSQGYIPKANAQIVYSPDSGHLAPDSEMQTDSAVDRYYGSNRFQSAVSIMERGWDGSDTVIITYGKDFPDALASVPYAYSLDVPILLTEKSYLPDDTISGLEKLDPLNVIILGGLNAVSIDVEKELTAMGLNIERIAGGNRYQTAVLLGDLLLGYDPEASLSNTEEPMGDDEEEESKIAILAYSKNYPDALGISSAAAENGWPILFTDTTGLNEYTEEAITNWGITDIIIVGGTGVVGEGVVDDLIELGILAESITRIAGNNRYETAALVSLTYYADAAGVVVATGANFPDALSGGPLAAKLSYSILLTNGYEFDEKVDEYFANNDLLEKALIFGGTGAVSSTAESTLRSMLSE